LSEIITIEKVIHGGFGLARTEHGAVLVPGTLPGETVEAEYIGKRHGIEMVAVVRILEPSPDRRTPPCRHFGICGGCDWLFMEYSAQLELKKVIFLESMERIGRLQSVPDPELFPSPEFGYRRRAQLKINAQRKAGFFKRGSNDVVEIDNCPLLTERINGLMQAINDTPLLTEKTCNLPVIDGDTILASAPPVAGFSFRQTTVTLGKHSFDLIGTSFFQGNRFLVENLGKWGTQWGKGETFLDLYGGTGFFSLMFADGIRRGWLIESERKMVDQARENFRKNGVDHIAAVASSAEKMEQFLPRTLSVMVVDPPRPGLTRKVREAVARIAPDTIVYVSCNCTTQARDCGFLCNRAGYHMVASALFDLYPSTHHIESVIVLQK